jgi:hypothetical protein
MRPLPISPELWRDVQRAERERARPQPQPMLELPLPQRRAPTPERCDEDAGRGVVIIDLLGD